MMLHQKHTRRFPTTELPALENPRHEGFGQALARGMSASAAYGQVGFKPHRARP
jgi:hypothetical protein